VSRLETGGRAILTAEVAERIAATIGTPAFLLFAGRDKPR